MGTTRKTKRNTHARPSRKVQKKIRKGVRRVARKTRRRKTKVRSQFASLLYPGLRKEFELAYRGTELYPDFIRGATVEVMYATLWDRIKFAFLIPWI